ncbi:MAG: branched-chain amino acid ABC transporter permease [Treponemataceae bacterium]
MDFSNSLIAIIQNIINGLSLGSFYALIAIGYTMVYGIIRLINFAHGDTFMLAAYTAFFSVSVFRLPWMIAIFVVITFTVLISILIERIAYRPLRDAPKSSIMISAIGVSFLLENLATYFFSGKPKAFPDIPLLSTPIKVGSVSFQSISVVTPIITIVLLLILLFIINKTKIGMAMRAVSKDHETARLMGIKINFVITTTFALGAALAAVGAILWGVKYPQIQPLMGVVPGLKCFIAAVVGGIGNITGAVLSGFILGLGEILIIAFFPSLTGYRDAFAFVLLILVLIFKPTGLLGEKITEKV